jgi:FtsH-binding integral membrane protein
MTKWKLGAVMWLSQVLVLFASGAVWATVLDRLLPHASSFTRVLTMGAFLPFLMAVAGEVQKLLLRTALDADRGDAVASRAPRVVAPQGVLDDTRSAMTLCTVSGPVTIVDGASLPGDTPVWSSDRHRQFVAGRLAATYGLGVLFALLTAVADPRATPVLAFALGAIGFSTFFAFFAQPRTSGLVKSRWPATLGPSWWRA